ncbi:MAG: hypothetical protein WCS37_17565, partial [Chloroflexota bacterium]
PPVDFLPVSFPLGQDCRMLRQLGQLVVPPVDFHLPLLLPDWIALRLCNSPKLRQLLLTKLVRSVDCSTN